MARGMSRCASTISSVTKLRKFLSQGLHDALDDEGNGDVDGSGHVSLCVNHLLRHKVKEVPVTRFT